MMRYGSTLPRGIMNTKQYTIIGRILLIAVPIAVLAVVPAYPQSPPYRTGAANPVCR